MLFDLKGKRRRTVQATYVALAFLMVIGLVGAGVGSGVSGGVFDLFSGGSGKSTADKTVQKRIDAAQKRLLVNPKDQAAMVTLVRSHYSLASLDTNQKTGAFGKDGKAELLKASAAWQRYLASSPKKPDASLAAVMLNAFGKGGLNKPPDVAGAAEIIALSRNDAQAYLRLAGCATLAGQSRKATLAGQRAIALAPKDQLKAVKGFVTEAKVASTAPKYCSG
ncbi:MAG: hypothetical protein QOD53_1336 [Thermoleophilaceae bacterium]|nr:hypothetical protein [Thermoleophilaceae bacterium]